MRFIGQGHSVTLGQSCQYTKTETFLRETTWPILTKFHRQALWNMEMTIYMYHMTKMVAMPIYGKNPSKIFSGTAGPIFKKFGI